MLYIGFHLAYTNEVTCIFTIFRTLYQNEHQGPFSGFREGTTMVASMDYC